MVKDSDKDPHLSAPNPAELEARSQKDISLLTCNLTHVAHHYRIHTVPFRSAPQKIMRSMTLLRPTDEHATRLWVEKNQPRVR